MSKKRRRKHTSLRRTPTAAPQPPIDRLAAWLGRRSRPARGLICAGVALAFTVALALMLYGALFYVPPQRLSFGPINAYNLPLIVLLALSVVGFTLYWVGWRVMIGFDFEETPLQPGRPAALWVMLGAAVFVLVVLIGGLSLALALRE